MKGLVKGFESRLAENDVSLYVIALRKKTWGNPSQPFTPFTAQTRGERTP